MDSSAPTVIFVQITYRELEACPGYLAIRTHIALSEDAEIERPHGKVTVNVDTYGASEDFIELAVDSAEAAEDSVLISGRSHLFATRLFFVAWPVIPGAGRERPSTSVRRLFQMAFVPRSERVVRRRMTKLLSFIHSGACPAGELRAVRFLGQQ